MPLDGVEKNAGTGFDAVPTTVPAPPFANTVHNHLAIASEVPKMEQLSLTPAVVEPAMTNALDFPAPVSQATVATQAETVTSSYIAMETGEPSSTVDFETLLQCLGDNNHLVTTGNQTFDSLNIEPRQPEVSKNNKIGLVSFVDLFSFVVFSMYDLKSVILTLNLEIVGKFEYSF